jgi:hypothetical protein
VGDACFGSVAPVRDAAEGVLDRQVIDSVGVVFVRPFFGFLMALVGRVCNRFKPFVEAWNAAAILERPVSFAANVARIRASRLTSPDIGDGEPMLSLVAEVVCVVEDGLSWLQHVAQAHFACHQTCSPSPRPSTGHIFVCQW